MGHTIEKLQPDKWGCTGCALICIANPTGRQWHHQQAAKPLQDKLQAHQPTWKGTTDWGKERTKVGNTHPNTYFEHLIPSKFKALNKLQEGDQPATPSPDTHMHQLGPHPYVPPPPLPPRRWDPLHIYYTDGSKRDTRAGPRCGAGLYHPAQEVKWRVNPSGEGHTDTINRAELVGIMAALIHIQRMLPPTAHILTDSLGSLWQLHRLVLLPATLAWHPHRHLLQEISFLLQSITQHTQLRIGKVKAHIGVDGNEKADFLAGMAAVTAVHDWTAPSHPDPYKALIWPHHMSIKEEVEEAAPFTTLKHIRTVPSHLAWHPPGVYQRAWSGVEQHLRPGTKGYVHKPGITKAQKTQVVKAWVGATYNQKWALRFKRAATSLCPMPNCKEQDSVGHILGECQHPALKGLHIKRHDDTVIRIAKAMRHSNTPKVKRSLIMVDAASTDSLITRGVPKRLAAWLFNGLDGNTRARLRPVILLLTIQEVHDTTKSNWKDVLKAHGRLHILEVGYGGDTFYERTYQRKQEQHRALYDHLTQAGWIVDEPHLLLFGHGGSVYKSTWDIMHKTLDIPAAKLERLFSKIQRVAAERVQQIIATRRIHEPVGLGTG